jgi:hypothetical protein
MPAMTARLELADVILQGNATAHRRRIDGAVFSAHAVIPV